MSILEIILIVIACQLAYGLYLLEKIRDDASTIRAIAWKQHFGD